MALEELDGAQSPFANECLLSAYKRESSNLPIPAKIGDSTTMTTRQRKDSSREIALSWDKKWQPQTNEYQLLKHDGRN